MGTELKGWAEGKQVTKTCEVHAGGSSLKHLSAGRGPSSLQRVERRERWLL